MRAQQTTAQLCPHPALSPLSSGEGVVKSLKKEKNAVNVNSREWMVLVSGFSLLLLVGCSESSTSTGMKADAPKVSMSKSVDEKMAYAPEPVKKSAEKMKAEKVALKTAEPKIEVAMDTKTQAVPGGSFIDSEHLKPVYFDLHRSKLSDEAVTVVQANAEWIKTQPPFLLEIIGVADSRGSASRNKTLAERRALNVKLAYANLGISPDRIQIVSLGEDADTCKDMTEDCFKLSRRADTKIEEKALLAQR